MRGTYKRIKFQSFPEDRPVRVHDIPNAGSGSRQIHHHLRHLHPRIFTGETLDPYRELMGRSCNSSFSSEKIHLNKGRRESKGTLIFPRPFSSSS